MELNNNNNNNKGILKELKRVHVFISGRVQGIFFRSFIQRRAMMLELKGWVRNTDDDRVECVFEGTESRIQSMLEHCRQGPPGASVENVEVKKEEPTNAFTGFGIRY